MDRIGVPAHVKSSIVIATLCVTACERGLVDPEIAAVIIAPEPAPFHSIGDTLRLRATVVDDYDQSVPVAVSWGTLGNDVATVGDSGLVRAVGNGQTMITASAGGVSDTVTVEVEQRAVAIDIVADVDTLRTLGDSVRLSAVSSDERGNSVQDKQVSWTSSDSGVARVDEHGFVHALSNGEVVIRAAMDAVVDSALVVVHQEPGSIVVLEAVGRFDALGVSAVFVAEARDAGDNAMVDATVSWRAFDSTIVQIDGAGNAVSRSNGTTVLEARAGDAIVEMSVTVAQVAESITVSPAAVTFVAVNDVIVQEVVAVDRLGVRIIDREPSWVSRDPLVARVSQAGRVTAVRNGTTTVEASMDGVVGSSLVIVSQRPHTMVLTPETFSLTEGDAFRVEATVVDRNGHGIPGEPVVWSSDDSNVATVDSNGVVAGVGLGIAEISVAGAGLEASSEVTVTPMFTTHGLNFSPYMDGQNPNDACCAQIPEEQLRERMAIVAPYTDWIRTFGCSNGLEAAGRVARELGLQIAAGAWLSSDLGANEVQLACLIDRASAGEVDIAVVGGEVLLRGDFDPSLLVEYINRFRAAVPDVPVTYNGTHAQLLAHPEIVAAVDVVLANIYPYWEGIPLEEAIPFLNDAYRTLESVAGGKQVIVGETGWPSCGDTIGRAVANQMNATTFFREFQTWSELNGVDSFYFEAYDEAWKTVNEGRQGACWGLWDSSGRLKLDGAGNIS